MRRLPVTFVCAVFAAFLFADFADAQLFRRSIQRTRTVQNGCPGGVCPTATTTRQAIVSRSSHWTYPGTISGHLQGTHGVSTAGMTREQMLDAHDALHEGRSVRPTSTRMAPIIVAPVVRPAIIESNAQTAVPVSSPQLFGLGEVSSVEPKAEIPSHILAQVDEPKKTAAESFKSELTKAINTQRKAGKISLRDAIKLRVAMLSPAFVERAHELAVTQVAFSGEASEAVPMDADGVIQVEGINWEGLTKFLEAIIPLILTLIKAFGV